MRVHLQWGWKGQLYSHAVGHNGGNVGEYQTDRGDEQGQVGGSSTALALSEHCVEIVGFAQDCLFLDAK